jgi:hypothetical protein
VAGAHAVQPARHARVVTRCIPRDRKCPR